MGLDTTHDAWHGPYSSFGAWMAFIAESAGLPPLALMDGFYEESGVEAMHLQGLLGSEKFKIVNRSLPIKWECLRPEPVHFLLNHSDCDGDIPHDLCDGIANDLERIIADSKGESWLIDSTLKFITGLRLAAKNKENLEFH